MNGNTGKCHFFVRTDGPLEIEKSVVIFKKAMP